MKRNQIAALIFIAATSAFVAGCGGAGGGSNNNAAASTNNSQSPPATSDNAANVNAQGVNPSTSPATNAGAPTNAPATANKSAAPTTKMPTAQIGSGANDFYLFTKVRGAIDNDSEMKNSSVIINVSNGNITLTGGVADAQQKAKAEQLARAAEGVKSVKNELRVGAVAPPR